MIISHVYSYRFEGFPYPLPQRNSLFLTTCRGVATAPSPYRLESARFANCLAASLTYKHACMLVRTGLGFNSREEIQVLAASRLFGWPFGWLVGWLSCRLVGWLFGRLSGRLFGCRLARCSAAYPVADVLEGGLITLSLCLLPDLVVSPLSTLFRCTPFRQPLYVTCRRPHHSFFGVLIIVCLQRRQCSLSSAETAGESFWTLRNRQ